MKGIMIRRLFVIMLACTIRLTAETNQLCKIFFHNTQSVQSLENSLEQAKVSFYFNHEPEIDIRTINQQEHKKEMSFLFPEVIIKASEVQTMMRTIAAIRSSFFSVSLKPINKPVRGLQLLISYDPQKIDITYDRFDSIGLYKGIVFTFFDKELLEKIKVGKPLVRMVSNTKYGVIIDCGHGGNDTGTISPTGIREKDIVLGVGLKVADLLRNKGFDVHLTRETDVFVPLDKRTCCQTNQPESIFISLHANNAINSNASGIETFCLGPPLLNRCFKTMDDYTAKVLGYITCERYKKDNKLATYLQRNVVAHAQQKNSSLKDRHVRYAVSQVLLGTTIPAALIELGFLSNPVELSFLQTVEYQHLLATGICRGIEEYFSKK